MYSLKNKLNKSLLINMMLVMLLMLIVINVFIRQLVNEQIVTRLQHDAESLVSIIQFSPDNLWEVNPAHISTVYNRVRSGHYYIVQSPQQTLHSRSLFDFEVSIADLQVGESRSFQINGAGEEVWLVWQQKIKKNNQPVQIWVAEDITPFQQQLIKFSIISAFMVILITALLVFLQQKILNRAFHIFDVLRTNIQAVRHGETEKAGTPVPVEISPLVTEIDMLVEQLRLRIQRTRNAIGNLAHEIKRPLQLLSLYIDNGEDKKSACDSFDEIQLIVDREMRRAKISASSIVGGEFKLQEELPVLLDVMRKIYPEIESELIIQHEVNAINLDRDDMLELTGNLIDNACKYAATTVRVDIKKINESFVCCVEDDGDGVDANKMNIITRKGVRLDESRQGHGLGLSICFDIIQGYHGDLNFDRSTMGGLKVTVSLPLSR